ncbi:MAG: 50S ribosomal protein L35 [Chloroflexi bacterium ADurb.Bin120]|jgi:large subunit ribosomal protein L35|uniref:large ribosomal subunit protein bL35 n=1 Tax=Candidatus Brevifilum fermentans TaxID=1986204 RepID=UPI0009D06AB8|nr:50S ribosomal protein L35 [Brevefilum fermentans]MDI9565252.1 bL35 family ribosomal protein [Chloroflexota bacterium]OQB84750.1 MAG: 50S ribosomal protein L35 [Chloroflexi bacterium ADurb.Bin120]HOM67778.1 bL35 family ribosomal protein [Brevefilum fermentans]
MPRKPREGKYKMKTHKATSKRFRTTGSGAILRTKIGKGHLRRRTPARTKLLFERMLPVKSKGTQKKVRRLAPYLGKKK